MITTPGAQVGDQVVAPPEFSAQVSLRLIGNLAYTDSHQNALEIQHVSYVGGLVLRDIHFVVLGVLIAPDNEIENASATKSSKSRFGNSPQYAYLTQRSCLFIF